MAETFKMVNQTLTTAEANVYVSPANTTSIIILSQAANSDGANSADITMYATDSSANTKKYLTRTVPVPADSATTFLTGKLVLEERDVLVFSADTASGIKFIGSILETLN